jgi:hypothetical protein
VPTNSIESEATRTNPFAAPKFKYGVVNTFAPPADNTEPEVKVNAGPAPASAPTVTPPESFSAFNARVAPNVVFPLNDTVSASAPDATPVPLTYAANGTTPFPASYAPKSFPTKSPGTTPPTAVGAAVNTTLFVDPNPDTPPKSNEDSTPENATLANVN